MSDASKPLWRLNESQGYCNFAGCRRRFTETFRGKKCSGCTISVYCGADCQKKAWGDHKRACTKVRKEDKSLPPPHPLQLAIHTELGHLMGMNSWSFVCAARTALRLGRPDSMVQTHFLHLTWGFRTPSAARLAKTSSKPVGDERDLFQLIKCEARPDSYFGKLSSGPTAADKKRTLDLASPGHPEKSFFVFCEAVTLEFAEPCGWIGAHLSVPPLHEQTPLPFTERKLNPKWPLLLQAGNADPVPKNENEVKYYAQVLVLMDYCMSESLETMEKQPVEIGGKRMKDLYEVVQLQVRAMEQNMPL